MSASERRRRCTSCTSRAGRAERSCRRVGARQTELAGRAPQDVRQLLAVGLDRGVILGFLPPRRGGILAHVQQTSNAAFAEAVPCRLLTKNNLPAGAGTGPGGRSRCSKVMPVLNLQTHPWRHLI